MNKISMEVFFQKKKERNSLSIICKFHSFTLCTEFFNADDWTKDFLSPNLHRCTNICYDCRFNKEPSSEVLPIHCCSLDQLPRNQNWAMWLRMRTCGRAPPYKMVAPSLLAVEMNFFIFSYWIKKTGVILQLMRRLRACRAVNAKTSRFIQNILSW
jgi:hypothetical protein